jgi:quinol monooxygenase YgiN
MIVLIGKVTIQPNKREQFLTEVGKAVQATLKEDGINRYELVEFVGEPDTFGLIEEYVDEAALAAHSESEHRKTLVSMLGDMLAGPPEVKRYNVSSSEIPEM